jgi:hypothetical protein
MPLQPTTFHCGTPGCTTPAHDARDAHEHTFNEATRQHMEAEAAAVAKKKVPQTLVNCMRPDCRTDPHGQDIAHVHTFASNKKGK